MQVSKSCLRRRTPWAKATQYYHLNARLSGEPQGALGPVDDSSHLHLWLKLYYSLFHQYRILLLLVEKFED